MTKTGKCCSADSGRAVSARASVGGALRRRRAGISALAVLVGGCLSACGTGLAPAAGGSASVPGPIPSGLESFYRQAVNWYPCAATDGMEKVSEKTAQASASTTAAAATTSAEATAAPSSGSATGTAGSAEETDNATFSCAVISVPLDYANPKGETISIAMKKRAATDGHSQGTLFINPGGPGDSGVSFAERVGNAFSPDLLNAYDIIGFDPRGVGSSTAITCSSDDDSSSSTAEPSASAGATASPSASAAPSASPTPSASALPSPQLDSEGFAHSGAVGNGTWTIARAVPVSRPAAATVYRYVLRVEGGTHVDAATAAPTVERILNDERGWPTAQNTSFQPVADPASADFTFNIATPPSADALCSPLDTGGMWNCRNGDNVVINSDRWNWGAITYPDVDSYRTYVTNHEVGHFLGHEHEFCAGAGLKAPLMAQQSHDLAGGCVYNAWPTQDNQPG